MAIVVEYFKRRAEIVRGIRAFFDGQGFVEVETPVRIKAPAPEEHIDCPPVTGGGYLRASPELQMKKLLAAGMERIYQIGPCFRDGERGARHNPEFTMIEWYRRDADYLDIKADLSALLDALASDNRTSARPPDRTISVRDAYREHAGWDPWEDWDQDRFDFDMATKIEPAIKAMGGGVFLMDYPPQAASLAKLAPGAGEVPGASCLVPGAGDGVQGVGCMVHGAGEDSPGTKHYAPGTMHQAPCTQHAERWEFYWDGIELANCFTELCDGAEQTRRFEKAKAARRQLGEADYPIDREFLAELPKIRRAAGVALGVDRLVMALTGAKEISSVRVVDF